VGAFVSRTCSCGILRRVRSSHLDFEHLGFESRSIQIVVKPVHISAWRPRSNFAPGSAADRSARPSEAHARRVCRNATIPNFGLIHPAARTACGATLERP
jgi:hypothetical protein